MTKSKAVARKRQLGIVRYFRETIAELRKVNWPTRQEATQLTMIVLVVVFLMSMLLGLLDLVFSRLFGLIVGLG